MDQSAPESNTTAEQRPGLLSWFIPRGEYFITPIILDINILVFLAMVASGIHPVTPDGEALLRWGANFKPYTMHGQPWRMLTAMFLHYGIIHLVLNMYALVSVGRLLEMLIGRVRFLSLYLLAGLGGSAVSLWWHDIVPGVGASGAIFGLFGVLAAILTTDLIVPEYRKQMLRSVGGAILLNLGIGLWGPIDNSAHIGGLLSGMIGSYLCYFDLKALYREQKKKFIGLLSAIVLISGGIIFFWKITPPGPTIDEYQAQVKDEWNNVENELEQQEKRALDFYQQQEIAYTSDTASVYKPATAAQIDKEMVKRWQRYIAIVDSIQDNIELTDEGQKEFSRRKSYAEYRLKASSYFERFVAEKRRDLLDSSRAAMEKANSYIISSGPPADMK